PAAADALLLHPARDRFLDHNAADNPRIAHRHEDGPGGVRRNPELERDRADLIQRSAVGALHSEWILSFRAKSRNPAAKRATGSLDCARDSRRYPFTTRPP